MLMIDKQKAISTVMDRRRSKDGSTSEASMKPSMMKSEDTSSDPRHEAAKDILVAINDKHPGKLMEAMAAFHNLHEMHTTSDEEVSDDES